MKTYSTLTKIASGLTLSFVLLVNDAKAQSGFYVAPNAKVFFAGDSASIFSNVINDGKLGVGQKAVVNFQGKKWDNNQGLITDESNNGEGINGKGGVVRFISADSTRQQINGGYNAAIRQGASFGNLQIQNKAGVELVDGTAKVRNELNLAEGHVYLNDNMLVVGNNNNPGTISGYDSSKYIVANQKNGGMLLRENISRKDGQVVFPVGTKENAYTPAAITAKSVHANDYYVSVADGVQTGLFSGNDLSAKSVNKTWEIGKVQDVNHTSEIEIALQHLIADEGAEFSRNREKAYVAQYKNAAWDTVYPQSTPAAGTLTTGAALDNSGVNTRMNVTLSGSAYFTKLGMPYGDTLKTVVVLNAHRLDKASVSVYWTTKPEVNVNYFVVERRLANEANFTAVDSVDSKAVNGLSRNALNYIIADDNNYTGNSFYRLRMVDFSGNVTYSNIVVVGNKAGIYNMLLWPNPTPDKFFVSWNISTPVKTIVVVNALGQKVKQEDANGRSIIEMGGLRPGTYFVSYILTNGTNIETKKLVVTGN